MPHQVMESLSKKRNKNKRPAQGWKTFFLSNFVEIWIENSPFRNLSYVKEFVLDYPPFLVIERENNLDKQKKKRLYL